MHDRARWIIILLSCHLKIHKTFSNRYCQWKFLLNMFCGCCDKPKETSQDILDSGVWPLYSFRTVWKVVSKLRFWFNHPPCTFVHGGLTFCLAANPRIIKYPTKVLSHKISTKIIKSKFLYNVSEAHPNVPEKGKVEMLCNSTFVGYFIILGVAAKQNDNPTCTTVHGRARWIIKPKT